MGVILKLIPGYEGYVADNLGNIYSYWGRDKRLKTILKNEPRRLNGCKSTASGHLKVSVKGGKTEFVHRLVYKAFFGDIPKGLVVRHINDIATDNRPENLVLGTMKDNSADSKRNGRLAIGEKARNSKLKEKDVRQIRELYKSKNYTHKDLSLMYGINKAYVSQVINRKVWKHVD